MDILEIQETWDEEEQELYSTKLDTEADIDIAIDKIKELNTEEERFQEIYNERVELLKHDLEQKLNKINSQKDWLLSSVAEIVRQAPDKKETKTQWKKSYLSGDIVIKKATQKLVSPKIEEKEIKEKFKDYQKNKVTLNWAKLKKVLRVVGEGENAQVVNTETGEDLTGVVPVEFVPEKVVVK